MRDFFAKRKSLDILSDDQIWTVQGNLVSQLAKTRASIAMPVLIRKKKHSSSRRPSTAEELEKKAKRRNWILAVVLLSMYITLAVATSQLTNFVFQNIDFQAPFLFTLLKMACRITMYPVYLLITSSVRLIRGKKVSVSETFRHCENIYGPHGLTVKILFRKLMPCVITMILCQIFFTFGIANLSAAISTSFSALGVAIAYVLSWFVLKQKLLLIKVIFVLVSLAGVVLISYASFTGATPGNATLGVVSSLISVLMLVLNQFAIKLSFPKGDLAQVSLVLATASLLMSLIFWPVVIITKITGIEQYDISMMPIEYLLPTWFMSAVSSVVYGYGIVVSNPFFMSIGELVILAANSIIDGTLRGFAISISQIIGTILVGIAFIVMVLPDQKVSIRLRKPKVPISRQSSLFIEPVDENIEWEEKEQAQEALEIIQSVVPDAVSIYDGSAQEVTFDNEEAAPDQQDQTRF